MAVTFDKDMNIITNFLADMDIIAKLDDQPNDVGGLTAAELKAKFDEGGKAIQQYINESLIPEVIGLDATEAQRQENEAQRQEAELERESRTNGIVAQATERVQEARAEADRAEAEANRAQAEADRATVPAAAGIYNVILSDRATGQRYALMVENGALKILGVSDTLDAAEFSLVDSITGQALELVVESGILKLQEV